MEEYLKTLLEQIRCKKARSLIEEELRGHLEEQIEENRMSGMEPEEAEKIGTAQEEGGEADYIYQLPLRLYCPQTGGEAS